MKKILNRMDKPLFWATILMCGIGLVMVFSASSVAAVLRYKVPTNYFFSKQAIVMAASIFIGIFFILRIPIYKYKKFYTILMIIIMLSLIGVKVYSTAINGASSWFKLGPISIQPSEFAKAVSIIYMASFFGTHMDDKNNLFFIRPIIACMIVSGLIFVQPDLGTTAIVSLIVFFMFLSIPFKNNKEANTIKIVGIVSLIFIVLLMILGGKMLNSEQMDRLTYKDPCSRYKEKTGYQVCNGIIAINNGGLFGVGLGNSTQKYMYLPEAHTDFIFPIIVEELGCAFGIFVILLYLFILYRLLYIAKNANELTGSLISYGTALMILLHLIINFCGILALIPLTGVPLPLLSYGGSITINTLTMLFICLRVSAESQKLNGNTKIKSKKEIY